jgi:hypothetical protein
MKKCFILILCSVASLLTNAQMASSQFGPSPGVPTFSSDRLNSGNGTINSTNSYFPPMSGTHKFDDLRFSRGSTFREGELRTRKGLFSTGLGFRFDQLERTIEVQKPDGTTMYLNEKDVLYCKIFYEDNTQVVFMPVALPNETKLTLLEVVYKTPTLQLYRHRHAVLAGGEEDFYYYARKGDKDLLQEVDLTAKSFSKVLPEKSGRVFHLFKNVKKKDIKLPELCKMMGELDKKAETE